MKSNYISPSKKYEHIGKSHRYVIEVLLRLGKTNKKIAEIIKFSPSTISREIKRNSRYGVYNPKKADRLSKNRKTSLAKNSKTEKKKHTQESSSKKFQHLNINYRYVIEILLRISLSIKQISENTGISQSTISREIKRNSIDGFYDAKAADELSKWREFSKNHYSVLSEKDKKRIRRKYKKGLPVEYISCVVLKKRYSINTIYYYLRSSGLIQKVKRKMRRFKTNRKSKKYSDRYESVIGIIKNRVGIENRDPIVNKNTEYCHWEADLIVGKNYTWYMLVMLERKSRYVIIKFLENKDAKTVKNKIINALRSFRIKTLTVDNGPEFAFHKEIREKLECKVYFTKPFAGWQKGRVENCNRLIREYFPATMLAKNISQAKIEAVEIELNKRYRKGLMWKAPIEFLSKIKKIVSIIFVVIKPNYRIIALTIKIKKSFELNRQHTSKQYKCMSFVFFIK